MIQDHSPVPIESFNGLFGVDSYEDTVPVNYFIDELNTITFGNELKTRDGVDIEYTSTYGGIRQISEFRRQGEATRLLALIDNTIWDLTTNTPIYSATGMQGFAIAYYNNRAFISPHDGISGLMGYYVQAYNGIGTTRQACGEKPAAGFTAVVSATTGHIEAGIHIFAWVFETDSGFVTAPCDALTLEFDGTKAVSFFNTPVGPPGTATRRLIASRAIQEYNGNPLGYEMFFVPGGRINDNSTMSKLDINFFDADLQLSADYCYDQLDKIPAVVFITTYGHRMIYGGPNLDKNLVYISKPLEPESIHSSAGFIPFDPFESEGVKDATEFRDNLYVMKRNKTYTTRDNTYEPSTWKPVTLDSSIGCDINGIARFWDHTGSKVEFFCVAAPSGIYKFTGVYEEFPITKIIKAKVWDKYNKKYLNKGRIIFDQDRLLLYVLITFGGAVEPNYILVGNYENGFAFDRIKWHLWNFYDFSPSCIVVDRDFNTKETILKISSLNANIYKQEVGRRTDYYTVIMNHVQFALIGQDSNNIMHCGGVGFRIAGSGELELQLFGQDNIDTQVLRSLILSSNPGKEFIRKAWLNSEKISLKISMNDPGSYFSLKRINLYMNTIFNSRPNV